MRESYDDITSHMDINDMKELSLVLLLLFCSKPALCQKGAFTLGFTWGLPSRGGFTLGYFVTDDFAIETHAGAIPHTSTWGISAKYQPISDNDQFYLLWGLSKVIGYGHVISDGSGSEFFTETQTSGMNVGLGGEIGIRGSKRVLGLAEGGIFIGLRSETKRITYNKQKERKEIKLPEEDQISFGAFLGLGVMYYSKR